MLWAKTNARRDEKRLSFGIWCGLYYRFDGNCLTQQSINQWGACIDKRVTCLSFKLIKHLDACVMTHWPVGKKTERLLQNAIICHMTFTSTDLSPGHTCTATHRRLPCDWKKNSCNQCDHCAIRNCIFWLHIMDMPWGNQRVSYVCSVTTVAYFAFAWII